MGFLTELRNEIRQTPQTVRDIRDFLTQDIFGPFQAGITLSEQLPRHKGLTNWDQQTNPFKGISLDPERVTFDAAGRFKSGAVTQDDQDMGFLAVDYDKNGDPQAISIATMQYADVRLVVALTKTATGFDFRCAEIDVNPIDDTYTMQEASSHITETRNHGLPLIPTSMAAFSLLTASMYEALCYLPGQETTGRNQLFDFIDSMRSSVFSSGLPSSNFYVHAPTEVSSERLSLEISSSASSTYSINLYQNTETASSVIMLTNDVKGISYEISSSGVRFFTPEGYLTLSEIDIQAVEQLESVLQAIQKRITGEIASLNLAEGVFPGNVFTFVPSGRKEALLPYQEALATAQATLKSHTLPVPSTGVMDRTRHFAFAQKIAPDVHIGILDEANIRIDAEGFGVLEREGIEIGRVYQMGNTIVFYELATNTMLLFDPQTGRSKIFLREVPSTDYKELEPVIEDVASQQVFKMHDAVLIALQLYQKLPDNQTGMKSILSGMQDSNLLILAARPGQGKTAMAINIAQHVGVKEKKPVGVFSLEMSQEELVDRLLVGQADVDAWKLKTGRLSEADFTRLSEAMGQLADAPIFIDDTPGISVNEMRTKARRLQLEHGIGLLIVDYLQLVDPGKKVENRVQEVSIVSKAMKNLARELKIPVIALSQLNRSVEHREKGRPVLADLRESGSIEQDADVVMFLYRPEEEDQLNSSTKSVKLIIAKHRNGAVGDVDLLFRGDRIKFFSVDKKREVAAS